MRIISGLKKGRRLATPKDRSIRPTTDRTKQFIFDYLGANVADADVLDLFSGTGNLGLESLSRGASHVTFVENNRVALKLIEKNLEITGFESKSRIVRSNVWDYMRYAASNGVRYDLIFADPPYLFKQYQKFIEFVDRSSMLNQDGHFILEHESALKINFNLSVLKMIKSKKSGVTTVSFFVEEGEKN